MRTFGTRNLQHDSRVEFAINLEKSLLVTTLVARTIRLLTGIYGINRSPDNRISEAWKRCFLTLVRRIFGNIFQEFALEWTANAWTRISCKLLEISEPTMGRLGESSGKWHRVIPRPASKVSPRAINERFIVLLDILYPS